MERKLFDFTITYELIGRQMWKWNNWDIVLLENATIMIVSDFVSALSSEDINNLLNATLPVQIEICC
jgi:hypothetical protein